VIYRAAWAKAGLFAIPACLAIAGSLEYAFGPFGAPPLLAVVSLYAAVGALLLRRRFPLAAPLTALAVLTAESFVDPQAVTGPATPLFVGFYCFFVIAAYNEQTRAAVGAIVALLMVVVLGTNTADADVIWLLFVLALMLVAWGSGLLYGRRGRDVDVLAARGEQLEGEYAAAAARALTDERARIAREIHDIVAHNVSVIVLQARGGRKSLRNSPDDARQAFDSIESAGQHALVELRRLLGIVNADGAPALAPQPGLGSLDQLVQGIREAGLPVDLSVVGDPLVLPAGVDLAAYRVVQEALTNTVKHAGGASARVLIRYEPTGVDLEISDDGPPTPASSAFGSGRGLIGMRERVSLYGGAMENGPRHGGGYIISVHLPVPAAVS
jgi:signal transduction histidine kinase